VTPTDLAAAGPARLTLAAVNGGREVLGLPIPTRTRIAAPRRTDRLSKDLNDGGAQSTEPRATDRADRLARIDARQEQSLGGVDIPQSGDTPLIHEEELCGLAQLRRCAG
jgi:hypothetical protein